MCDYHVLYHDHDGYVIKCAVCGYYQVAFSGVMLTLRYMELQILHAMLKDKAGEKNISKYGQAKKIVLPTSAPEVNILLTQNEVNNLYAIIERADSEEKAQAMMRMFNT